MSSERLPSCIYVAKCSTRRASERLRNNTVVSLVQDMGLLTARMRRMVRKALQTEQPALQGDLTRRDQKGEAPLSETSLPDLRGERACPSVRGSPSSVRQQRCVLHRGVIGAYPTSTTGPHTCLSAACDMLEYMANFAVLLLARAPN